PSSVQNARIFNQELVIPNGGMTPPLAIEFASPQYTPEARANKVQGVVTILTVFDVDGNPRPLAIVKGLGFGLDENAIAAVQNSRFAPAYRNGRRVSVVANVDVRFTLMRLHLSKDALSEDANSVLLEKALKAAKLLQELKAQRKP